jgi:two-component system, response regulator PdtaR
MLGANESGSDQVVLVVEDDSYLRIVTADYLRQFGLSVLEAPTADEAVDVLACADVGLVLTDVQMPGMSGIEFARLVHALQPRTPVIVTSGRSDAQQVMDELGQHTMFVAKPYDIDLLGQEIVRLIADRYDPSRHAG